MNTLHDALPTSLELPWGKHWDDYTPAERAHVQAVRDRIAGQYPGSLHYPGADFCWAHPDGLPDDHDDDLNRVLAERITVFDWPSGPVDAPAPDRDTGSMMQFKFITPSLWIARAVDPEKRPLQAPPMFPGWSTSGPTAPWPPERREGLAPGGDGAPCPQ